MEQLRTLGISVEDIRKDPENILKLAWVLQINCNPLPEAPHSPEVHPEILITCRTLAPRIHEVSKDRVRFWINNALSVKQSGWMFRYMQKLGILKELMPDLHAGVECYQNKHHIDTVFEHLCYCVDQCIGKKYHPMMKMAVLFHDIAKPHTKKIINNDATFYKHEVVGASLAYNWMREYGYNQLDSRYVRNMVREHQWRFTDDSTDKAYLRWLQEVGRDGWRDLVRIRIADRKGNRAKAGRPSITSKMKDLIRKVRQLIREGKPIFREDLPITMADLIKLDISLRDIKQNIYPNLIGIVRSKPEYNNREWLLEYIKKHYVQGNTNAEHSK